MKRLLILALSLALDGCRGGARPAGIPSAPPDAIERLHVDIDRLLDAPALDRATWGVTVRSLSRGDDLYSRNPRKLLMPASNMKVVTLAAAAERLGWDYTYRTDLVASGPIADGVLAGDLVVVGTGDPSIDDWSGDATRLFRAWASQLAAAGIRRVTGRIVGDDREFANEPYGAGWAWDDLDHSYGAAAGALQFNENTARILIAPGPSTGQPAIVSIEQPGTGLALRSTVRTRPQGSSPDVSTRRLAGSPLLEIRGSIPFTATAAVRVNVSVANPTIYFLTALRNTLVASGIDVEGEAVDIDALAGEPVAGGTTLVSHRSPPLRMLAVTMMKNSQNLYAETLLRTLGGRPATLEGGRDAELAVLRDWGVASGDIVVADGSGLSRADLITAGAMAMILARVDDDAAMREPFEAALPVAGVDGTLSARMKGTPAERNVRAKTGSFTNARALSGYVRSADGEPLVFSIIANNYAVAGDMVEQAEDAIAVRLAQFSRR